ncbi:MAG: 4-hydroxythreonine-4-phosphate dehydrogenase PdxA, partial [Rhizobiaceae bacterium]
MTRPLALTLGDPSGIGPEIALKAWLARGQSAIPAFALYGDPDLLSARAHALGLDVPVEACATTDASSLFPSVLPVVRLAHAAVDSAGAPDPANAAAIIESIDRAVADTLAAHTSAVVTCPIAKKPLYDAGFGFPGHTEYLAHLAQLRTGIAQRPVMMLAGPDLRTVPVTIHIPLRDVVGALSTDLIVETGRIVARDLARRFGIAAPRIAVAGLNPHAGEGGAIGREDEDI